MRKILIAFVSCILILNFVACNSSKTESNTSTIQSENDSTITITAKYISGGSLEGDAVFVFEKEDGNNIEFYRNYNDSNEPKLQYEFLSDEGVSGNVELLDSVFVIKYKQNPKGQISMMTGEGEPCNQILSIKKK